MAEKSGKNLLEMVTVETSFAEYQSIMVQLIHETPLLLHSLSVDELIEGILALGTIDGSPTWYGLEEVGTVTQWNIFDESGQAKASELLEVAFALGLLHLSATYKLKYEITPTAVAVLQAIGKGAGR